MTLIEERRSWDPAKHLLIIGPGAAGKSSLGPALASLLGRRCVDVDREFTQRIGDIGVFIRDQGYERYKLRNAALVHEVLAAADSPIILITSSGFLTRDNPGEVLAANRHLLHAHYSICLLPSRDMERAVEIIVERQLQRPFARDHKREEELIRARYPLYAGLGDLTVFSAAPSDEIARAIAHRLMTSPR